MIGNPPFLGDKKMRSELGDAYTETLRKTYAGRVPGGADLVCYWFEKSRAALASQALKAAGLVATNSIRGGKNRAVLDAIVRDSRIYEAWSDEPWVNEGAAVRVSLVAFGGLDGARLDGKTVEAIHADLTASTGDAASLDVTTAKRLSTNVVASFIGAQKNGPFEVAGEVARAWLSQPNPTGESNALVLRPWVNGMALTRRDPDMWIVDFGGNTPLEKCATFEAPFEHVLKLVKPTREGNRDPRAGPLWWLHKRSNDDMRRGMVNLDRYAVTPRVAKHRVWVWRPAVVFPDSAVAIATRADDTTFGILHSRFHELWALRMGTSLEDRPRYTPTTCFETFPFPAGLTPADTAHQQTEALPSGARIPAGLGAPAAAADSKPITAPAQAGQAPAAIETKASKAHAIAIAEAAHRLDALRQNWLNPPEWTVKVPEVVPLGLAASPYPDRIEPRPGLPEADAKALQKRTLTNLYNQRPAWLAQAHAQLDAAVAAAYGWQDWRADMADDEILRRLLALNHARAKPG